MDFSERKVVTPAQRKNGLYELYEWEGKKVVEVNRFNPLDIFLVCLVPSLTGCISCIVIALLYHHDAISNYNWQCGRARLPSLSRIINLPLERTIWQMVILYHAPMRVIGLATGFTRFARLRSNLCSNTELFELSRYAYLGFGVLELGLMIAISIIGERENIKLHVVLFYAFGLVGMVHFFANIYCHRYSIYFLKPYGVMAYRLKVLFFCMYVLSAPVLCASFFLYWKACITVAYDIFAITEYAGVVINISFHCLVFFDIRHKVIFSVRHYEPLPPKPIAVTTVIPVNRVPSIQQRSRAQA
ncbi:unnamed protein product, partial [Mesorhabditis belari]|uniref:CWH43-like N-terminal domain-containing protein n=1 Tax=Mesorhabditis belari TaxID=2138241 RepID=A0AAF3FI78_9BILA